MRPIKASLLFVYCLAALTVVGTAISHLWKTAKDYRNEASQLSPAAPSGHDKNAAEQPS